MIKNKIQKVCSLKVINATLIFCDLNFQGCAELSNIWSVGQKMWLKDYTGTYEALQKDWSDEVKGIMTSLQGKQVETNVMYTSIRKVKHFLLLFTSTVTEAISLISLRI